MNCKIEIQKSYLLPLSSPETAFPSSPWMVSRIRKKSLNHEELSLSFSSESLSSSFSSVIAKLGLAIEISA